MMYSLDAAVTSFRTKQRILCECLTPLVDLLILAVGTLGYRNASETDERHLETAKLILNRFRYVGLQEAYNSSALLLASVFDLDELESSDFAKQRHTSEEELMLCKGYRRRAVGSDPTVCRAVMRANYLDVQLYEFAHRAFCSRLEAHGLRNHPAVAQELAAAKLCGDLDWSDPEQFCSVFFENPEMKAFREKDSQVCARQIPSMHKFRGQFES
jgi:hypothetical protein